MTNPTAHELPENIRKCMSRKDRAAMKIDTIEDRQDAHDERSERDLQRLCERELSRRGIAYLHLRTKQQAAACPGWPDLTFAINGIAIACELKSPSGKLSIEQESTLTCMRLNGWHVNIVRNFDHFRHLLDGKDWIESRL